MSSLAYRTETRLDPLAGVSRRRLRVLSRSPSATTGLVLIMAICMAVAMAPVLARHDPLHVQIDRRFQPPSRSYPLGTDELGRDVLARVLYGGRTSLGAALLAAGLIAAIGVSLGLLAGYCKGAADMVVSRLIDVALSFPSFLLALAIVAVLGRGIGNVILAIGLSWWGGFARFVRSLVLAEQQQTYVQGARAMGASPLRVLARHLLPNILGPVLVLMSVEVGGIILSVSALSFLGLGVGPPFPEWGSMVAESRNYVGVAPHMIIAAGAAILLVVLACNLMAEGVQDVLEPSGQQGRGRRGAA